jgi:hypothetical protein
MGGVSPPVIRMTSWPTKEQHYLNSAQIELQNELFDLAAKSISTRPRQI